jgi:multidrug efflux pump subunit AcrA (membrane-fusion protein)
VLKADNTVEQRVVKVGEMIDGWVPAYEGLSVGEKVVISGISKLASGMKVMFAEATSNDDIDPAYEAPIKE